MAIIDIDRLAEEGSGLGHRHPLAGDAFQELLRENSLGCCKECFNQRAKVVKITLLDATPKAWAISNHD
jgi:hypothetical protein